MTKLYFSFCENQKKKSTKKKYQTIKWNQLLISLFPKHLTRLLFIDYSLTFNTIIPNILINKLLDLHIPPSTCAWIKDFLSNRPQRVKLGPHLSSSLTLSTGSPQGCVLSLLLYSLYNCVPLHPTNSIIKFADDTTEVRLIKEGRGDHLQGGDSASNHMVPRQQSPSKHKKDKRRYCGLQVEQYGPQPLDTSMAIVWRE